MKNACVLTQDRNRAGWASGLALPGRDDSDFNGTPAIVGRQLFLRSNRNLYCIQAVQAAGAENQQ